MFASFGLPFHCRSRCEKTRCANVKANKGQTEALPHAPAESDNYTRGSLVADAFVVDKEVNRLKDAHLVSCERSILH